MPIPTLFECGGTLDPSPSRPCSSVAVHCTHPHPDLVSCFRAGVAAGILGAVTAFPDQDLESVGKITGPLRSVARGRLNGIHGLRVRMSLHEQGGSATGAMRLG